MRSVASVIVVTGLFAAGCDSEASADCDASLVAPALHVDASVLSPSRGLHPGPPVTGTLCVDGRCSAVRGATKTPGDLLAPTDLTAGSSVRVTGRLTSAGRTIELSWSGRVGTISPYGGSHCLQVPEIDLVLDRSGALRPGGHRLV